MFVGQEMLLEMRFAAARDRLAHLATGGALLRTSEDAYGQGTVGLTRVGAAGLSKLVRVQVRQLAWDDDTAALALRWEATGSSGALFPVLDADLRLAPVSEHVTLLTMAGSYRPPLGALGEVVDRAILHRVAMATIRSFLARVTEQITGQSASESAAPNGAASPPEVNS